MNRIIALIITLSSTLATGSCATTSEWRICEGTQGIAAIPSHGNCEEVAPEYFTKAQIDLEDEYHIKALLIAARLLESLGKSNDQKELIDYLGEEWFRQISAAKSSAITGIAPDFSNTLGSETYRIIFKNGDVVLFVESITGEHEWARIIE